MGKSFVNKFKKKSERFTHKIGQSATKDLGNPAAIISSGLPTSLPAKIPGLSENQTKNLATGLNPVKATKQFIKQRGTKRGKRVGRGLEFLGGALSTVGTVAGQPELGILGAGLTAAGGYEKGEKTGQIIGETAGSLLGGQLGGGSVAGQLIGSQIGSQIGGHLGGQIDKYEKSVKSHKKSANPLISVPSNSNTDTANTGRGQASIGEGADTDKADVSNYDQLKKNIAENAFIHSKNQHSGRFQLPPDLQAIERQTTLGEQGLIQQSEPQQNEDKLNFETAISQADKLDELMVLLANNSDVFSTLSDSDRNEVLDEILRSGLFNNYIKTAISDETGNRR